MSDSNFISKLQKRIFTMANPSLLGLDPKLEYLPPSLLKRLDGKSGEELAAACTEILYEYNSQLLEAMADLVPAVKFQMAYYEQYGLAGLAALKNSINLAKELGYFTIIDGKRNDIGATAEAYAKTFLETAITPNGQAIEAFQGDALTVNMYLGTDGIKPFTKNLRELGKGIFLLLRTSNPSGGEIQDLNLADGRKLYESLAERVAAFAEQYRKDSEDYSPIGVVVGATYPKEAAKLRRNCPHLFFLVPGYGAQGATAEDVARAFDKHGGGAIINSSRGLMNAWQKLGYDHEDFARAARTAAIKMKDEFSSFMR